MQFRKRHIKAAAIVMLAVLAGCSRAEFSGGEALAHGQEDLISFSAGTPSITRAADQSSAAAITRAADQSSAAATTRSANNTASITRAATGIDAAAKLNNRFVVYGTKHNNAESGTALNDEVVFDSYTLEYSDGTSGSTVSNSAGWEYADKTSYDSTTHLQSLKYWDYSASHGYTFYAFSSKDISYPADSTDKVSVIKTKDTGTSGTPYKKGYTVNIKSGADISSLYFADRKPIAKSEISSNPVVRFNFRSFGAKVRVGFYETIPGYSVTITNFHYHKDAREAISSFDVMDDDDNSNFRAALQNVNTANATNQVYVTYRSSGDDINQPATNNTSVDWNYNLTLGDNLINKELGTTSATAIYDRAGGAFTDVYPFEQNTAPMLVCLCYTITAEDGQGEQLNIERAKAVVPVPYVQWKSNCCYTYLFKITEKTNGTTGTSGTDPEGLYDIVFDAVSVSSSDNDQTNLISVDRYSITTFLDGDVTYIVNTNKETGEIYIPTGIGYDQGQAQMYDVTTTGDEITDESIYLRLTGTRNGITLSPVMKASGNEYAAELVYQVPATDGTYYTFGTQANPGALKYTSETGHCYAYVYCNVKHVDAVYVKLTSGATYDSSTTYYTKNAYDVYTPTSIENQDELNNAITTGIHIRTTEPVTGDYAVLRLDTRSMSY